MRRLIILIVSVAALYLSATAVHSKTMNEADTKLCETLKYTLIRSLSQPINDAVSKLYKDDTKGVTWAGYDTEIVRIKQLNGIGGAYEVTLKIHTYYGAHNRYGLDEVIIRVDSGGHKLVHYKHLKTYT